MPAVIIPYEARHLEAVREIYFESSTKKNFKDAAEKEAFFEKYLGYYLKNFPEFAWVAFDQKVLGYLVAAPITKSNDLYALQPHLKVFETYFDKFPAHLHINCHHEARGLGLGSMLMEQVFKELHAKHINGLHIMTSVSAPNRAFYKKLGFDFESELPFNGSGILFMGKRLSDFKF